MCAAACGQLMMVERRAYEACGGHAAIRFVLHDALQLARLLRLGILKTGYIDPAAERAVRENLANTEKLRAALPRHRELIRAAAVYRDLGERAEAMGIDVRFPGTHETFLKRCHAAGQRKPTPLLLRYGAGDYNCLHQDLYGEHVFPLQLTLLLSAPGRDFTGGEFVITEQRPRMQSRAMVVPLAQGDAVIFAVRHRPVRGTRGAYRVNLRHGVSEVRSGQRNTAGIIFHDAQ